MTHSLYRHLGATSTRTEPCFVECGKQTPIQQLHLTPLRVQSVRGTAASDGRTAGIARESVFHLNRAGPVAACSMSPPGQQSNHWGTPLCDDDEMALHGMDT